MRCLRVVIVTDDQPTVVDARWLGQQVARIFEVRVDAVAQQEAMKNKRIEVAVKAHDIAARINRGDARDRRPWILDGREMITFQDKAEGFAGTVKVVTDDNSRGADSKCSRSGRAR